MGDVRNEMKTRVYSEIYYAVLKLLALYYENVFISFHNVILKFYLFSPFARGNM